MLGFCQSKNKVEHFKKEAFILLLVSTLSGINAKGLALKNNAHPINEKPTINSEIFYPIEIVRDDTPIDLSLPKWVYAVALLEVYFSDGTYKQGYATLLESGHYIASSETLYANGKYPKTILAKMQDDSAKALICIANLRLRAIDRSKGLSLLQTSSFNNDYCQKRQESYYHARIYTAYAQTFYLNPPLAKNQTFSKIYYPTISEENSFSIQVADGLVLDFLNPKNTLLPKNSFKQASYLWSGRPYFSDSGELVGVVSTTLEHPKTLVIIPRENIRKFLNDLKKERIF
ncbi:hypothetical protein [Helicobacter cetorum]|uniref:hypothetical protein n=1 Tax=Helicobacter cetorum TaxID=138563 RepID=UPI000CF0D6A1|nr:hypothetical protein [Helicobacter cetorum]